MKREERRLRAGHLWVFSNEVDVAATPLRNFEPGQGVEIQDFRGRTLGTGYVNPHSLICARLLSRDGRHPFSASLIVHRLKVALALRERLYAQDFYRVVYGEGDGLPGLIVDRYERVLVVQITTAGMERLREQIVAALIKVLRPEIILLRNNVPVRDLEQLPRYTETVMGQLPERVTIVERDLRFTASLSKGQKTGWFFDQYENRGWIHRMAPGKRVLDLFAYVGAWGVQAAAAGASEVLCVDESSHAVDLTRENAALNAVSEKVSVQQEEAFVALNALVAAKERFDVVVLDPPAFIKRKKDFKQGINAYRRLNELAMRVLSRDGILVSCSCSYQLKRDELVDQMRGAARHLDRGLQLLGFGHQAPDHPIHPSIPETEYLKMILSRVFY
jgi:23S rRNA (cytosine1962-C5)-methyltransferase